jgi:metal-dependent amidase/aminoacylase/carboxypeptidase family protein
MIIGFNAVNSLRQHIRNSSRIHGIIRDGGSAANIVPAHSSALFMVRAADILYLDVLKTKVINCFKGAAQATGAMLDFRWSDVYCMPMKSNNILANIFKQKLEQLGRKVREDVVDFASTDMGNVSQRVPSIHPVLAITNKNIALHSSAFLNASASPAAVEGMLDGARAMALTVIDILSSPDLLARIRIEHSEIEG